MIKNKLASGHWMILVYIVLGIIVLWLFISLYVGINDGVSSSGILSFLSI